MRIQAHSSLTQDDVRAAIKMAREIHGQDVWLDEIIVGPRGGIQFWCHSQHGKFTVGRSHSNLRAASWHAYGWVIAELFRRDPNAHIGQYASMAHFVSRVTDEHERYYLRMSLGVTQRTDIGADISFIELCDADSYPDCPVCGDPIDYCQGHGTY